MSLNPMKFVDTIGNLLDKIIPDKDKALEAKVELSKLASKDSGEFLDLLKTFSSGQQKLNEIDANSGSFFRAGWRPAIGWICVFGLGWEMIVRPFAVTIVIFLMEKPPVLPSLDMEQIMGLVTTLLGLGALRTYEKLKGKV